MAVERIVTPKWKAVHERHYFVATVSDVVVLIGILTSGRNIVCTTEAPANSEPIPAINVIVYCATFPIICNEASIVSDRGEIGSTKVA